MIKVNEPVSLNELAKELGLSKSTLTYYAQRGLLIPITSVGRMQIFEKSDVINRLSEIKKGKDGDLSLDDIKKILDEKNNSREN